MTQGVEKQYNTRKVLAECDSSVAQSLTNSIAAFTAAMTFAAISSPALALASDASNDGSTFNHQYSDPLHPKCRRTIEVSTDGKSFHYSGTAVGKKDEPVLRGCTPKEIREYGLRQGEFDGAVLPGLRISAGDGIHEGVWEPANTATTNLGYEDVDGIRWSDGNKWVVKEKTLATRIGEFVFLSYIGFSTLAGIKGLIDGINRKRQEAANN